MKLPSVVADVLRVAAPTLAAALGGPLGPVAAAVASTALNAWLPSTEVRAGSPTTPAEVVGIIQAHAGDPKLLLDLRQAELDLARYEREMGFRFAELEQKDRSEARAVARDTGLARVQFYAGMSIVALSMLMLFGIVTGCILALNGAITIDPAAAPISVAAFGLLGTVTGVFQAVSAQVLAFYFGSSAGSADKQTQIADTMRDLGSALGDAAKAAPAKPAPAPVPAPAPAPPPVVVVPTPAPAPAPAPEPVPPPVQASRFVTLVDKLFEHEGGWADHPSDPGGCTNLGITLNTLRDWRQNPAATCDDVRALTRAEAKEIYRARYWNVLCCDRLPAGVDYEVFDFGVNAGPSRAARFLQTILARREPTLKVDGVIGPLTLAAVSKATPRDIIEEFHAARMEHYRSLSTWPTFGAGWKKRADEVREAALADAAVALKAAA